jgi:hypothetical protein
MEDKGSIGNYKGVMLCTRPPEPGNRPPASGPAPFRTVVKT